MKRECWGASVGTETDWAEWGQMPGSGTDSKCGWRLGWGMKLGESCRRIWTGLNGEFFTVGGSSAGSGKMGRATSKEGPVVCMSEAEPEKEMGTTSAELGGTKIAGLA